MTWATARLHQLPVAIRSHDDWKAAAMIVGEANAIGLEAFDAAEVWSPILEGRGFAHYQRARRRDCYAWRAGAGEWRLGLVPPAAVASLPIRFRAPGNEQVLVYVLSENVGPRLSLNLCESPVAVGDHDEVEIVTLAGDRYRLTATVGSGTWTSGHWMSHAREDRTCADWTAVARWADQAFRTAQTQTQLFAAATRQAGAAAITEDGVHVDLGVIRLQRLLEEDDRPRRLGLRGRLRRLRAQRALMGLLAIDSKLAAAIAIGLTALQRADPSEAQEGMALTASRALVRADLLGLMVRSIEMERGRTVAIDLERDLAALASRQATSRMAGRAVARGLEMLWRFYFEAGETALWGAAAQRAKAMISETDDDEARYWFLSILAQHADYEQPADEAAAIFERVFRHDSESGRTDRVLDIAPLYLRLQFNTGRQDLARLLALELI